MKVSSVAIIAAVLGTSTAFAQESFTLSKGRRSAGKARSDTVSNLEQCQQICNTFFAPSSGSVSSSAAASAAATGASNSSIPDVSASNATTGASNSSIPDVSASNATVTAANVSSTADATAEATPSIPAQNMAAVESGGANSDPECTRWNEQADATPTAASGSHSGMGNAYAASAASGAPSSSDGEAASATGTGAASSAATTAAAAASNGTSSGASGDQAKYLDLHNQLRAKHGANPVTWDSTLADYANTYASKCVFEHSSGPYGENLAATSDGNDPITWGMNAWAEEAAGYDYSSNNPASGTGHFTQMVWKATTAIGCAMVECPGGTVLGGGGTGYNIVCEYNPPGNMGGAYTENVGAASS